jgi:hypothetical protein
VKLHHAAALAGCLLLPGCSARAPQKYPANQGKVFITSQALPEGVAFDPIRGVHAARSWYGSSVPVLIVIADQARKLGANAIIEEKTWYSPHGFGWATPHCAGQAVWVSDVKSLESRGVKGDWY